MEIKAHQIKNHLSVFVNCLIVNPAFDSQTKELLTTTKSKFGSKCALPDSFLKKLDKCGLVESILAFAQFKAKEQLGKKGGVKRNKLLGIAKLDDANNAGTAKGK
jgi:DNA topoisomerase-2